MTPKQVERIKNKITKIKKALAADKKHWGGYYRDGQGLRYAPPELYLKLEDYTGALRYFNWFHKNFPNDACFPNFLFEWTITLFKTKRVKQAEKKALETFFSNTYLINQFLGKELINYGIYSDSSWELSNATEHFPYSKKQEELADFANWLEKHILSEKYIEFTTTFIKIERQILTEPVGQTRSSLFDQKSKLLDKV